MPVPSYPIKVVCQSCGWHLIITSHRSDLVTAFDLLQDAVFNRVPECGRCGSTDLRQGRPTFLETVNPIEYGRKLAYLGKRSVRRKKRAGTKSSAKE